MTALPAGATVGVRGAGERAEVTVTRQAWLCLEVPLNAGLRAAQAEATAELAVDITGLARQLWL
eukprot:8017074-Lingulodinium_polyedra.AAC.1